MSLFNTYWTELIRNLLPWASNIFKTASIRARTINPNLTGTWKVNSTWIGDETHAGSSSTEEIFHVKERVQETTGITGFPLEVIIFELAVGSGLSWVLKRKRYPAPI